MPLSLSLSLADLGATALAPVSAAAMGNPAEFLLLSLLVLLFVGGFYVITLSVRDARRGHLRDVHLREGAPAYGWNPVPSDGTLPAPVAASAPGEHRRLVMTTRADGRELWLVWHRWTETDGESSHEEHRTRCYLRLGKALPDMTVTYPTDYADPGTDQTGAPSPADAAASGELVVAGARRQVLDLPVVRLAMEQGAVWSFDVSDGFLVTSSVLPPRVEDLEAKTSAIVRVAQALEA